jgi:hypothetical protein
MGHVLLLEFVVAMVEDGGDHAHRLAVAPRDKVVSFRMFKERILRLVEEG